jgi:hypothetical protein
MAAPQFRTLIKRAGITDFKRFELRHDAATNRCTMSLDVAVECVSDYVNVFSQVTIRVSHNLA